METILKLEKDFLNKPLKEKRRISLLTKLEHFISKYTILSFIICSILEVTILINLCKIFIRDLLNVYVVSGVLWLALLIPSVILLEKFPTILRKSIKKRNKNLETPTQDKEFKKLQEAYSKGQFTLSEIYSKELQTNLVIESDDYKDLETIIKKIKNSGLYLQDFQEVFGKMSPVFGVYKVSSNLIADINEYISRNHLHSILEIFKIYPLLFNFSNVLDLLKEDKNVFLNNKEDLRSLEEISDELLNKLNAIKNESKNLYDLTTTTDSTIRFKNVVKELVHSKQYL